MPRERTTTAFRPQRIEGKPAGRTAHAMPRVPAARRLLRRVVLFSLVLWLGARAHAKRRAAPGGDLP